MTPEPHVRIVVGVRRPQPEAVIETAAELARRFDAELVCVSVNESRYMVGESATGAVTSLSFNPDLVNTTEEKFNEDLARTLRRLLDGSGVTWSMRALAGDPARAIVHVADAVDAAMIVVGTRESMRGNLHEFFNGSVAVHLAHRQLRPVVVVPLAPVPFDHAMPWDQT